MRKATCLSYGLLDLESFFRRRIYDYKEVSVYINGVKMQLVEY